PAPLRSRVVHAGRRGPSEDKRDAPRRGAHPRSATAEWVPALPSVDAHRSHAEEDRGPAARNVGLPRNGLARSQARPRRHAGRRASRLDPGAIALVPAAPVAARAARAREFGGLGLRGARGGWRNHRDRAARAREPRPHRGRGRERDPAHPRSGGDRRRAAPGHHTCRGRPRVPKRDRRRAGPTVRPCGDGVAALGRARVHRSAAVGHTRSDPPRGTALPGSGALRTARIRSSSSMNRLGVPLASALLALILAAASAGAEEPQVARHVLPNGLTVLVRENPAVSEVGLLPALRPDEIEKERRLLLAQIKTRADAPFSFSFDAVLRELYGTSPYGRSQLGSKESIERTTRDDLLAHYRAIYQPDRMVLAVSGQVERKRVIKAAERLFGKMVRSGADAQGTLAVAEPSGARRGGHR